MTARDFAQTLELASASGSTRGRSAATAARALGGQGASGSPTARRRSLRWARGRRFDLALGHGSNDVTVAAGCCGSRARRCSTTSGRRSSTRSTAGSRRRSSCRTRSRPSGSTATARGGKLRPLPGPQGGVLPRRLRARPGGARTSSASTGPQPIAVVRTPPVGLALPPLRERPVRRAARAPARAGPGRRAAAHATSSAPSCARAGGFIVPEHAIDAQSLVALRGPRDQRRRHDEPRGRRARHAGLDDVRGPARRGRRAADRRGPPAPPRARRGRRAASAATARPAPSASAATRSCSSTCSCSPLNGAVQPPAVADSGASAG